MFSYTDDGRIHGSKMTSTLEAGHTFDNSLGGLTASTLSLMVFQLGKYDEGANCKIAVTATTGQANAFITVGGEQSCTTSTDNLWVAAGYQHLY